MSHYSLHPQKHQCDLSLVMKFRGFPERPITHVWNGVRFITLIPTLTFISVPFMFVLVTDPSDTAGKIRPGISADPQLPLSLCEMGAFLTSVTSAFVLALAVMSLW